MDRVKLVEKRARLSSTKDIVKLQFILHCFANGIHLTEGDYNLLTYIAIHGYHKTLPSELVEAGIFSHKQSVRNSRLKLLRNGFLLLDNNKRYVVNPDLHIETYDNMLLSFKAIST